MERDNDVRDGCEWTSWNIGTGIGIGIGIGERWRRKLLTVWD